VIWTVYATHPANGGRCVSVQTDPALGEASVERDGPRSAISETPTLSYAGRPASCAPTPVFPLVFETLTADSVLPQGPGVHYVAGITTGPLPQPIAVFSDKSTSPVTVNDGTFAVVWVGPKTFVRTVVTYPTVRIGCGPDPNAANDPNAPPQSIVDWTCFPPPPGP
jgi:hypothetical protein